MMRIRKKFTKWYINRGYTWGYDFSDTYVYRDGFLATPAGMPKSIFNCPSWVKPLLIFFSPSVYQVETLGKWLSECFTNGIKKGIENEEQGL